MDTITIYLANGKILHFEDVCDASLDTIRLMFTYFDKRYEQIKQAHFLHDHIAGWSANKDLLERIWRNEQTH